ncbi:MAG TPA: hypothetical protein P5076_15670, partial [Myxococcota bacterium]|nr:hypothetical protein [Myxococcota bacterium]
MRRIWLALAVLVFFHAVPSARAEPRLDEVKRVLLSGDLARAAALAEELARAEPELREAWEIVAACRQVLDGAVPPEVQQRLAWRPPTPRAPQQGERWHVAATSLRLRLRANPGADVVASVPINTPVNVSSVYRDWVEVSAQRPPSLALRFTAPPAEAQGTVLGWVPWRYLSPAPLEKAALVANAALLEKQGFPAEALVQLERASALDPLDRPLLLEKARLAVAAHQYETAVRAVQAADPMAGAGLEDWAQTAEASVFLACRGNREAMQALDSGLPDKRLEKGPTNACVRLADPLGPCVPAAPFAGAPFGAAEACSPEYRGPQSERACLASVDAQQRKHEREKEKVEREASRFAERLAFLRRAFPTHGSAVRFTFSLPPSPNGVGKRLFAYRLPYSASSCQASFVEFGWDRLELSTGALDLPASGGPVSV